MTSLIVTGTDTGVGKTIFAAGLTAALDAQYWKPIQAGLSEATDSEIVAALTGCPVIPEVYRLNRPVSPHLSAEDMGITIEAEHLTLPRIDGPLVIEGAGGIMVPLNRDMFYLDLFARWKVPIIVVARTALGTINHTALSLAALRRAGCPVIGVAFNGIPEPEVEQTIVEMCNIRHLGRLGPMQERTGQALSRAFREINIDVIRGAL